MRTSVRILLNRRRYQRWFSQSRPAYLRQSLRDEVDFCAALAQMLALAGVDPDRCPRLREIVEASAAKLEAIPDTPELQEADRRMLAADPMPCDDALGPAEQRDEAILRRLAQRYADGEEPDFAHCPLADVHAFCVARLQPEAWGLKPGLKPGPRPPAAPIGEPQETANAGAAGA